ncbi:recombinase family protein [Leclercia adecarboxylata ATCC 23216 = NBRC 102595]|nr:recombinase family protein [Leclercia adecarboxylata ATCC 23216 = NBRC 102595]
MAHIAYIRVSTADQRTERQLADVGIDFAEHEIFEDHTSGKDFNRPAFEKMMAYVRKGDTIHVHSNDRLGRSTADVIRIVEELNARGVKIQFHKEGLTAESGSPMTKFFLTVLAGASQFEREMMLERQREGYAAARAAGRVPGRGKSQKIDRAGIMAALNAGGSVRETAKQFNVSTHTISAIKREMRAQEEQQ